MVKGVIDNQKAVMNFATRHFYIYRFILTIVSLEIKFELIGDSIGIYRSLNTGILFVEQGQYGFINVVVNQYNPSFSLLYEL